jgi:phosphomannomutase
MSKTGHAFIKERMRLEDAVYGGEMSAHHYFRDVAYCDSGMIPWLLVAKLLCVKKQIISSMVKERIAKYPSSGEINFKVEDAQTVINRIENYNWQESFKINRIDGIDMMFEQWGLNIRSSNTEPVISLNVESRQDEGLLLKQLAIIKSLIY